MRSQPGRPLAFRLSALLPAALYSDHEADGERDRQSNVSTRRPKRVQCLPLILTIARGSSTKGQMPQMVNGMAQSVPRGRHRLDRQQPLRYEESKGRIKTDRRGEVAIDLSGGSPEMDYAAHGQMYGQFLLFTKIAIVFLVLLLAGMGYFLT